MGFYRCRQKCFKYLTLRWVDILQPKNKVLDCHVKDLRSETHQKVWNVSPSLPYAWRWAETSKVKTTKHAVITNMTDVQPWCGSSCWLPVSHWTGLGLNSDQSMWVLWWTKDTATGFSPSTSVFSCQYHSIDIPFSFI